MSTATATGADKVTEDVLGPTDELAASACRRRRHEFGPKLNSVTEAEIHDDFVLTPLHLLAVILHGFVFLGCFESLDHERNNLANGRVLKSLKIQVFDGVRLHGSSRSRV